ncbi:MAG: hypothetical protein M3Z25_05515 [Actinomycetota bacterium]|nr:hypothetical protein [Actinomycetota bacterium]
MTRHIHATAPDQAPDEGLPGDLESAPLAEVQKKLGSSPEGLSQTRPRSG